MTSAAENNKRIAKNTLLLYFRMLLLMFIGLYTSRIVFQELGVSDFGLYNVVAGFVTMLTFLNGAMGNATQRFISYGLAQNDIRGLKNSFCQIQFIHILISLVVLILGETIGLWFVNNVLNIPSNRLFAANILYQCSLASTIFTIVSVPYNSVIIAHEKMGAFAKVGLLEGGLKLLLCSILCLFSDRLIAYGVGLMLVSLLLRFIYYKICKQFEETSYDFSLDRVKIKEIASYASWALCGSVSTIANMQGINVLINVFFSTIVNAARGIAYQVDGVVRSFVANFQTAINPQIVKSYAVGDLKMMHSYIFLGSKLSFFILLLLSIPVILNLPYLLFLWLGDYPHETIIFTRLVLVNSLIVSLSGVLSIAAMATGKIKKYQLTMGSFLFLNLPIAYCLFKVGKPPHYVLYVSIFIEIFLLFLRLCFLQRMIKLDIWWYLRKIFVRVLLTTLICLFINFSISSVFSSNSFFVLILSSAVYFLITIAIIYALGLDAKERVMLNVVIKKKLHFLRNET